MFPPPNTVVWIALSQIYLFKWDDFFSHWKSTWISFTKGTLALLGQSVSSTLCLECKLEMADSSPWVNFYTQVAPYLSESLLRSTLSVTSPLGKEAVWLKAAHVCSSCFYSSCQQLPDDGCGFVDTALLISNYSFKKSKGETQTCGGRCFQNVFPLSGAQSWQAKVALVHCGPQHHLALILCPDVGIWLCTTAYGSTYSPGEENKWFVFLLWSHSLCTYKTSFWRLETCACVESDISWYVTVESAFHFLGSVFY